MDDREDLDRRRRELEARKRALDARESELEEREQLHQERMSLDQEEQRLERREREFLDRYEKVDRYEIGLEDDENQQEDNKRNEDDMEAGIRRGLDGCSSGCIIVALPFSLLVGLGLLLDSESRELGAITIAFMLMILAVWIIIDRRSRK